MKNGKHFIALFYITLMLFFKVAGLHAFLHQIDDTDTQHCEVCHITTAVNFTPVIETKPLVLPQTDFYDFEQKTATNTLDFVFKNRFLTDNRFTRPPPQS
ncbi:hypothetical protein J8L85_11275 [Maribacter sp. MMG018]|uniref:hypothetical protein n=1 Tax=Maribacter sp. MMG018 TaxID=2822688 RepID=UPI001B3971B6|nr:hypothetical protein [Maribacter sp. MMG018]MBQ4915022.1 hypothetical protein [Maribacter sp. MMG018]